MGLNKIRSGLEERVVEINGKRNKWMPVFILGSQDLKHVLPFLLFFSFFLSFFYRPDFPIFVLRHRFCLSGILWRTKKGWCMCVCLCTCIILHRFITRPSLTSIWLWYSGFLQVSSGLTSSDLSSYIPQQLFMCFPMLLSITWWMSFLTGTQ